MVTSTELYLLFLGALALERLGELVLSRRNLRRALARGAVEAGRGHFPAMAAVHAAFLGSCGAEVLLLHRPFPGGPGWVALALALGAQGLRYWAVAALGDRWNVRVVFVPGEEPVTRGPYRFLRHPNYLAVTLEIAAIPLIHGAWLTALCFSAANAALLSVRIPAEESALGAAYAAAFSGTRRLLPRRPR